MIRSLLTGAIDYAGLFPPAGLAMRDAVRNFAAYRRGPDAWALGRFVVPAARLGEMAAAAAAAAGGGEEPDEPWLVSALIGGDGATDMEVVRAFNARHAAAGASSWAPVVDTVEARADSADAVEALAAQRHPGIEMFVEVPLAGDPVRVLTALAAHRLAAKVRTGGVTAGQIPAPGQVASFISEAARLRVPFKATAGLHHPLRGEHPLTYEPGSERGTMFGFLNVYVAAAAAQAGASPLVLADMLVERDLAAFQFVGDGVTWQGRTFLMADMVDMRAAGVRSFGSCSFEEPLADLRALGLL